MVTPGARFLRQAGWHAHVRRSGVAVLMVIALAGCAFPWNQPEPPPAARAPEPIGPVVEIGHGMSGGIAWSYSVYESALGTCTRLELDGREGGLNCGVTPAAEPLGSAIGLMVVGTSTGMASQVEGFASDKVAAVWIETDAGRVPAALMSLGPAGLDGQIFLAFVPPNRGLEEAVAVDANGGELARVDLP